MNSQNISRILSAFLLFLPKLPKSSVLGLIFVVDSSDRDRVDEAREELQVRRVRKKENGYSLKDAQRVCFTRAS